MLRGICACLELSWGFLHQRPFPCPDGGSPGQDRAGGAGGAWRRGPRPGLAFSALRVVQGSFHPRGHTPGSWRYEQPGTQSPAGGSWVRQIPCEYPACGFFLVFPSCWGHLGLGLLLVHPPAPKGQGGRCQAAASQACSRQATVKPEPSAAAATHRNHAQGGPLRTAL